MAAAETPRAIAASEGEHREARESQTHRGDPEEHTGAEHRPAGTGQHDQRRRVSAGSGVPASASDTTSDSVRPRRIGLGGEDHAVGPRRCGQPLHVLGDHVAPALGGGVGVGRRGPGPGWPGG